MKDLYNVSVVIPMYNAEKTILACLNSVIIQSHKEIIEIIVIDDGSTDNSAQIVREYMESHQSAPINLILKKNEGVSSARNKGLLIAKGNWIALLDSDDEWLPGKIERQIEVLKQNLDIDLLATARNGEILKKIGIRKLGLLNKIPVKSLLIRFVLLPPTVIFKKSVLNYIGLFDETQRYAEDCNYFMRVCRKYNCYLLNESLVITGGGKAHFGESGLSSNLWKMELGELKNIKFALVNGIINRIEFFLIMSYSILKYIRRVILTAFSKIFRRNRNVN